MQAKFACLAAHWPILHEMPMSDILRKSHYRVRCIWRCADPVLEFDKMSTTRQVTTTSNGMTNSKKIGGKVSLSP